MRKVTLKNLKVEVIQYRGYTIPKKGYLYLDKTNITELPDKMSCESLVIMNSPLTNLPKRLKCGDCDISGTLVKEIPSGTYTTSLNISETEVSKLPSNFMTGSLHLYKNMALKKLPTSTVILRSLYCHRSGLESLPEGMVIGDHLNIEYTKYMKYPKKLTVGGSVDVQVSLLPEIPKDWVICGNIYVGDPSLKVPDSVVLGGEVLCMTDEGWKTLKGPQNVEKIPEFLRWKNGKYIRPLKQKHRYYHFNTDDAFRMLDTEIKPEGTRVMMVEGMGYKGYIRRDKEGFWVFYCDENAVKRPRGYVWE